MERKVVLMRKALTLAGTVVNVFLPGVGTLIMGKFASGSVQLGLLLALWVLKTITFGLAGWFLWPIGVAVWIWAVSGGVITYFTLPDRHHKALRY